MINKKLLLFLVLSLTFVNAGQNWLLVDQEFDDVSIQPSDLEGWKFDNKLFGNEITYCGEVSLVGGYGSAGKGATLTKTFKKFPEHYKAKIVITVFFIDSWDNEFFYIKANETEVLREQSHYNWHTTALCGVNGGAYNERIVTLEVEFAHQDEDIIIELGSTLNENANSESWGVRDFQIYLDRCDDGCEVLTEEFQGDFTKEDISGWVGNREVANPITECEGQKLVGGYSNFGAKFQYSKTYEGLKQHYKVVIAFRLWMIDSWDSPDSVRVSLDGKSAFSQLKTMGFTGGQYQCGHGAWKDQAIDITIEVPHTGSSLEVLLEDNSGENANNESWGFSNWRIYTIACEGDCQTVAQELHEDSFNSDDIQGWTDKDGNAYNIAQACARTSIVGGYNALGKNVLSKTYTDLPAHTKIMLAIEVYFIDSWDNELFTITIDDVPGITTTKGKGNWVFVNGNQCGNGSSDEIQLLWVELPHFSDSAQIKLISKLNQAATDESWGFREINLYVVNETPGVQIDGEYTGNEFNEVAEGWIVENPVGEGIITECAGEQIVGGFNTFSGQTKVSKTFTNLPSHDFIEVYFKAYFIDSWEQESFVLQIDSKKRKQLTRKALGKLSLYTLDNQELCGNKGHGDYVYFVQARFQHSEPNALIEIFTMLDQAATDESWGFKDFHFFVGNNDLMRPDCPTLYTECGFKGDSFNLCENTPDFSEVDWTQQVHSVWVPQGWTATLYSETDYDGESHVFTEPVECLENGPNFTLIRINSKQNNIKKHNLAQISHLKVKKQSQVHKKKHSKVTHLRKNAHKL